MVDAKLSPGLTLALIGWSALAPLVGILVGHFLTRSWQKKQWLFDRRREEYRELLSTLTRSFALICQLTGSMQVLEADDMRRLEDAKVVAQTTIRDRIFIAREVRELDIFRTWFRAVEELQDDFDYAAFGRVYAIINSQIVNAATKSL